MTGIYASGKTNISLDSTYYEFFNVFILPLFFIERVQATEVLSENYDGKHLITEGKKL